MAHVGATPGSTISVGVGVTSLPGLAMLAIGATGGGGAGAYGENVRRERRGVGVAGDVGDGDAQRVAAVRLPGEIERRARSTRRSNCHSGAGRDTQLAGHGSGRLDTGDG